MLSGTFTVETSDNSALVVGESYPLTIDDSVVDVSLVTTSVVTIGAIPTDTSSTPTSTPTDASAGGSDSPNEISPGVPKADEPDTGLDAGETPAPDSVPPATA